MRLDELTTAEYGTLWGAVDALIERFTSTMDDPELSRLLSAFREALVRERAVTLRDLGALQVQGLGHVVAEPADQHGQQAARRMQVRAELRTYQQISRRIGIS